MAILDICGVGVSPITEIVFSDRNLIKKESPWVTIKDRFWNGGELSVKAEAVPDLIEALQKAVELGWTD